MLARVGTKFDNQDNNVPMIVVASPHSGLRQGPYVLGAHYLHYSLMRTIEDALGLPSMTDNDLYAPDLAIATMR